MGNRPHFLSTVFSKVLIFISFFGIHQETQTAVVRRRNMRLRWDMAKELAMVERNERGTASPANTSWIAKRRAHAIPAIDAGTIPRRFERALLGYTERGPFPFRLRWMSRPPR